MTDFWRQQKSAIYFGLFLLISVGLIFYSQSKTPEKARKLVQFSLEIVEKIEKNNLEILELTNQNFKIPENSPKTDLTNSQKITNSSPELTINFDENPKSENPNTKNSNSTSNSINLSTNLPKKIGKTDFEKVISTIEENQKSLENISWPESGFGTDAEIVNNLAKKLVEINQKNWQEIVVRLNLEKNNLESLEIANLEENVKDRNLEKTQKSLEVGREIIQKNQQKLFQNLKKNEAEEIEKNEKQLKKIDKSLKNLEKIVEIEKTSKTEPKKALEKAEIPKNNSQNQNSQNLTDSSNFSKNLNSNSKSNSEILSKNEPTSEKANEPKTVEKIDKNSNSNSTKNLKQNSKGKESSTNDLEKLWQEIENTFDKNWPKNQNLEIEIDQIETENWLSTKSELARQSKNLLKKYVN